MGQATTLEAIEMIPMAQVGDHNALWGASINSNTL